MNNVTWMIILLSAVAGCSSSSNLADVPKAVFVSPRAHGGFRVADGAAPGQVDVSYVAQAKFPAIEIREGLARALRESGYQVLDYDFLEPSRKLRSAA